MRIKRRLKNLLPNVVSRHGAPTHVRSGPPLGRGYIDNIDYADSMIEVVGWLFASGHSIDEFSLELDGRQLARSRPELRDDVKQAFLSRSEAALSGFVLRADLTPHLLQGWSTLEVLGRAEKQTVARIRLAYRPDFREGLPDPPAHLRFRVTTNENLLNYWLGGLQTFGEFYEAIRQRQDPTTIGSLLDWGCGCGRVASFFLKYLPGSAIHGCDIDSEAIAWCQEAQRSGQFTVIDPNPPTPYASSSFDVVTSYSVLTHLTQDLQARWLKEIYRILAPGGLLFASVQGEFAASFAADARVRQELSGRGISDASLDATLEGVAPEGYYRSTYQSRDYTLREFSKVFQVQAYIPQGMTNFQDLVVMHKQGEGQIG